MNAAVSTFDRRIRLQQATLSQDAAGDEVPATWHAPTGWPGRGKRWAGKRDQRPSEVAGDGANQRTTRQVDTVFTVRTDRFTRAISPETFRVVYRLRVYEIIGLTEGKARGDTIDLLCCSRPDIRGSSAPLEESDLG